MTDCLMPALQASYRARAKRANAATNSRFQLNVLLQVELKRKGEF